MHSLASRLIFLWNRRSLTSCYKQSRGLTTDLLHGKDEQRQPLNILFCGSDEFSIASLNCLADIKRKDASVVESIDVVCRTDKRVGVGLKRINEVPIKKTAGTLSLPVHQIDNFNDLDTELLSARPNLIVAVSFGLLIPARIIESATYGGLNVHPSLLPDLRGAAPIHHALLNRRTHTGITVQTLHPTKFDHGQIIAQTSLPGIAIAPGSTPSSISPMLAEKGATLLRNVIQTGAYMQPSEHYEISEAEISTVTNGYGLAQAPRIQKHDMQVDWTRMTASDIILRQRVFGRLWDEKIYSVLSATNEPTRIIFEDLVDVSSEGHALRTIAGDVAAGTPCLIGASSSEPRLVIFTAGDGVIEVRKCTIAGKRPGFGKDVLVRLITK